MGHHAHTTKHGTGFTFRIARDHGAVVVTVGGTVDRAGSIRLGAVLGDLIEGQGNLNITVDLRDVGRFDPSGWGVFGVAARLAAARGGRFVVTPEPDLGLAPEPGPDPSHLVEFYESDEALARSVAGWLAPALAGDDAAIVVATEPHRRLFETALDRFGVDVDRARAEGRYLARDARELLGRFTVGGVPDGDRFRETIGSLVARATAGGRPTRIYGEMVAVLWDEGNVAGALALEQLWNDLAADHHYALLCAYPVDAFGSAETRGSFRAICEQH